MDNFLTRVIARPQTGPVVYDKSFNLPPEDPEVRAALAKAAADLRVAVPDLRVESAARIDTSFIEDTRVDAVPTNLASETLGPTAVVVGIVASEASPLAAASAGGTPLGTSGPSGFAFQFTTPMTPSGCLCRGRESRCCPKPRTSIRSPRSIRTSTKPPPRHARC